MKNSLYMYIVGEVHGGRPRPTGAVVPRGKKNTYIVLSFLSSWEIYAQRNKSTYVYL
jgi:hypothetical protein